MNTVSISRANNVPHDLLRGAVFTADIIALDLGALAVPVDIEPEQIAHLIAGFRFDHSRCNRTASASERFRKVGGINRPHL